MLAGYLQCQQFGARLNNRKTIEKGVEWKLDTFFDSLYFKHAIIKWSIIIFRNYLVPIFKKYFYNNNLTMDAGLGDERTDQGNVRLGT